MNISNQNKIASLIELLKLENDKIVKMRAAIELSEFGKTASDAIPALLNVLKNDESSKVREHAVKALGQIGKDANIANILVERMLEDTDENVRMISAEALGELGEQAIPALLTVLRTESKIGVLEKTIETLGKIDNIWIKSEDSELISCIIFEIVAVISKHNLEILHIAAIDTILAMGKTAIKPLLKISKETDNRDIRTVIDIIFEKLAQKFGYRSGAALIRLHDY